MVLKKYVWQPPDKYRSSCADRLLEQIADYVLASDCITSDEAFDTARYCLMDTLGCGLLALNYPACVKLLGPVVPGATMPGRGARVPGTSHELDPVQAAFNIGAMIRWLDFNDTWLAAEWGHPSDNLGGILAVGGCIRLAEVPRLTVRNVLTAMIQAHEIQGVLALENGFNRVGLDHVLLVRIAGSTAVVTRMCWGVRAEQIINAAFRTRSSTEERLGHMRHARRIPVRGKAGQPVMRPAAQSDMH